MMFKSIKNRHDLIESIQERMQRIRAATEIGERRLTGMPGDGGQKDKMAAMMVKLEALEIEYIEQVILLEEDLLSAEAAIAGLPEQQQRIMRMRYLDNRSWRNISRSLYLSEERCFKIHREAKSKLEKEDSKVQ